MFYNPVYKNQSPATQILFLFAIFFLCYLLASLAALAITLSGVSFEELSNAKGISGALKLNFYDQEQVNKLKWAQLIATVLFFIVPPLVFARFAREKSITDEGPGRTRLLGYFKLDRGFPLIFAVLVPVLMMASLPLINVFAELNEKLVLPEFMNEAEQWIRKAEADAKMMTEAFLRMESPGALLFNLLLIAALPAFGEELLFRGVVQRLFSDWTRNAHWGIWIAAALFSALHGQFYGFLPRMALGALLGYLFLWSGSLWLPMLAHFVNNGAAVLVSYLSQQGTISKEVENIGTGEDEMYFIVSSALLVSGLIWMIWKKRQVDERPIATS